MRFRVLLLAALLAPSLVLASDPPSWPWQFGMTPDEVMSFSELGPYKRFKNGDVETYDAEFDGRKENIQFFFHDNRLVRIAVYLYEGKDIHEARLVWIRGYNALQSMYGELELPDIHIAPDSEPVDVTVLSIAAAANLEVESKTQMAPRNQPENVFVFSSFMHYDHAGEKFYLVIINFDPHP